MFLSTADIHLGTKEALEDTARVLGRMFDAIEFRGFAQSTVEALAKWSGVPVYNGLTDDWHPTQVLADLLTLEEAFGSPEGQEARLRGRRTEQHVQHPPGRMQPDGGPCHHCRPALAAARCRARAVGAHMGGSTGSTVSVTSDVAEGVKGADAVYTDVWVSMGEEEKSAERISLLSPYQVDQAMMEKTGNRESDFPALPARRERQGGHHRGDRRAPLARLGRGGEPQAHHQGHDARNPGLKTIALKWPEFHYYIEGRERTVQEASDEEGGHCSGRGIIPAGMPSRVFPGANFPGQETSIRPMSM